MISVLDFGAHAVIALIARKKKNGEWDILGGADVRAQGVRQGEIIHLGDAAECVTEVLRLAERSSGQSVKTLYFNFDHASIQKIETCGTKHLVGEGQIRPLDIRDAKEAALRMVDSFDHGMIYAKETGFLIDEKDAVLNPIGIYGRRVDVFLSVWMADSALLDRWNTLMGRAYVKTACPILPDRGKVYGTAPAAGSLSARRQTPLDDPACAGAAEMLEVAYRLEQERPVYFEKENLFSNLKEKLVSTWNEYF